MKATGVLVFSRASVWLLKIIPALRSVRFAPVNLFYKIRLLASGKDGTVSSTSLPDDTVLSVPSCLLLLLHPTPTHHLFLKLDNAVTAYYCLSHAIIFNH